MRRQDYPSTGGPYGRPSAARGPAHMYWVTGFAGFAVGLVLATFAWVGADPRSFGAADDTRPIFLREGELPEDSLEGDGTTGGSGGPRTQTRVIEEGDEATRGTGGAGGADVGGGESGAGGGGGGAGGGGGGVADNLIKLGATVAEDGIAKAFLGEVRHGMEAVRTRVNAAGGIHGRQLQVIYRDDGWIPSRGQDFINNLIVEQGVFALAVSPSSEGLNAASNAGLFAQHGVPVVGADGLNNSQFVNLRDDPRLGLKKGDPNPWIWPVAAATTTQAHVIMKDAWDRCESTPACKSSGGLRPAIVFGNTYRFGVEGAFAFNQAYNRLSKGKNIPGFQAGGTACRTSPPDAARFCGIDASNQQFNTESDRVKRACQPQGALGRCNFVLLLLEPQTAITWMTRSQFHDVTAFERVDNGECCGVAGAQPLFTTKNFAEGCGRPCHGMRIWTGYNPPVSAYQGNEAVVTFVRELHRQNPRADEFNQFTMGGYVGMTLLVEALERVGPELTRGRLRQVLNSMPPLQTGLTNPDGLRWTEQSKYANHSAQSFRIDYGTKFNQWADGSRYTKDPWLGLDNQLP